jgi:DNA-binding transcriptional regulator YiaG
MPTRKSDPHIDWSRFGKGARKQINAEARAEKHALGLTGIYEKLLVHVGGETYDIPIPDVRAIRTKLKLTQVNFAKTFGLRVRTVQQWEQRRALPDVPTRVLLRAIEMSPGVIAAAANDVQRKLRESRIQEAN